MILMLGYGFMGSVLYEQLKDSGHKVRVFSKDIEQNESSDKFRGEFGNLEKQPEIFDDVDLVIDLIHTTVPVTSMKNIIYDVDSNITPTMKMLEIMRQRGVKDIVYISSGGAVYGVYDQGPISEMYPTNPVSSYGVTKLMVEKYLMLHSHNFGLRPCILRPSNAYGPGQKLDKPQGIVSYMVYAALCGVEFEVWGDGEAKKDYLHVNDICDAIAKIIEADTFERGIFNIAYGNSVTVSDLIRIVEEKTEKKLKVKFSPAKQFDVNIVELDSSKFRNKYGWVPKISLENGVESIIEGGMFGQE